MEVVVSAPLCPLYAAASAGAERSDELLCGWTAELLEEFSTGWCRVRTKYRYEGWARREHLRPAGDWTGRNKRLVRAPFADVLARPEVESPVLDTLPRGALAAPVGEAGEGWQKIALPDGREGYTKCSLWEDDYKTPPAVSEEALRARAVEVALSYQGTQYRWGGKSPLGVDFPGHIALYLGNDRYIHSTARAGSDGVVINSLDPAAPDYRADLREKLYAVGSVFPLA